MRLAVLILSVVAVTSAVNLERVKEEWAVFKNHHKKHYASETEEHYRMKIFAENKLLIEAHNKQYDQGLVSFMMAPNKYGDLLQHEIVDMLLGDKDTLNATSRQEAGQEPSVFLAPANFTAPQSVDWRNQGAVTPVKDQGQCGSCWTFAAVGTLEGQHFRKTKKLVALSEQNLLDCCFEFGSEGCSGGVVAGALNYVQSSGIHSGASYPYEGQSGSCRYNSANTVTKCHGHTKTPTGDEEKLKAAVASVGPLSVSIDASQHGFAYYSSGVYYEKSCSTTIHNHAVLLVGYGTDSQHGDYWLVKNSWGASWGDSGYIKMARNHENHCGIANNALYPHV